MSKKKNLTEEFHTMLKKNFDFENSFSTGSQEYNDFEDASTKMLKEIKQSVVDMLTTIDDTYDKKIKNVKRRKFTSKQKEVAIKAMNRVRLLNKDKVINGLSLFSKDLQSINNSQKEIKKAQANLSRSGFKVKI